MKTVDNNSELKTLLFSEIFVEHPVRHRVLSSDFWETNSSRKAFVNSILMEIFSITKIR